MYECKYVQNISILPDIVEMGLKTVTTLNLAPLYNYYAELANILFMNTKLKVLTK